MCVIAFPTGVTISLRFRRIWCWYYEERNSERDSHLMMGSAKICVPFSLVRGRNRPSLKYVQTTWLRCIISPCVIVKSANNLIRRLQMVYWFDASGLMGICYLVKGESATKYMIFFLLIGGIILLVRKIDFQNCIKGVEKNDDNETDYDNDNTSNDDDTHSNFL